MGDLKQAIKDVEAHRKAIGRQCGACSMCCYLLGVDEPPEISKPPDTWCQHCKPGKGGCAIYERRPTLCRSFHCMWLLDPELEDFWYPLTARIVINPVADGNGSLRLIFEVDPRRPNRWLQEPYFTQISNIAVQHRGTTVRVGRHWFVLVPLKAAVNPASIAVGGETGITRVVPGKVGRNIVASPAGQFDWIEIEPMTEFIERGWRYGGKR